MNFFIAVSSLSVLFSHALLLPALDVGLALLLEPFDLDSARLVFGVGVGFRVVVSLAYIIKMRVVLFFRQLASCVEKRLNASDVLGFLVDELLDGLFLCDLMREGIFRQSLGGLEGFLGGLDYLVGRSDDPTFTPSAGTIPCSASKD